MAEKHYYLRAELNTTWAAPDQSQLVATGLKFLVSMLRDSRRVVLGSIARFSNWTRVLVCGCDYRPLTADCVTCISAALFTRTSMKGNIFGQPRHQPVLVESLGGGGGGFLFSLRWVFECDVARLVKPPGIYRRGPRPTWHPSQTGR